MHILYRLTFSNGKRYIGQTQRTMEIRLSQHRTAARAHSQLPVHCAWRKHGEPVCEVLAEFGSPEELHIAEVDAIFMADSICPLGYNLSYGGDTAPSKSSSVAAKIAAKALGRNHSEQTKAVMGSATKSNWLNAEYRAKVAAGVKESWTPERRAAAAERAKARNLGGNQAGRKHTPEAREKMRVAKQNMSAETKAKMSAAAKKRVARSPQHVEKLKASISKSWQDPEIRARRSAAIRAAWIKKRALKPPKE